MKSKGAFLKLMDASGMVRKCPVLFSVQSI